MTKIFCCYYSILYHLVLRIVCSVRHTDDIGVGGRIVHRLRIKRSEIRCTEVKGQVSFKLVPTEGSRQYVFIWSLKTGRVYSTGNKIITETLDWPRRDKYTCVDPRIRDLIESLTLCMSLFPLIMFGLLSKTKLILTCPSLPLLSPPPSSRSVSLSLSPRLNVYIT